MQCFNVVACVRIYSFLRLNNTLIIGIGHILFFHLPVGVHLGGFHFGALMNSAAVHSVQIL